MLCFWGEALRPEGLGLVEQKHVKCSDTGIRFFSPGSRIRAGSAGNCLMGFIDEEGKASVLKLNPGPDAHIARSKTIDMKKDKINPLKISCGEEHALLLANGGKVYNIDASCHYRPKELHIRSVIQVACGNHHSMVLTDGGQLFTWGQNSSGQLGLSKEKHMWTSPQLLKSLCGVPLSQISAGGHHSFALSVSGAVFGWGKNNKGQLGLGHITNVYVPTCVSSLNQKKTLYISCGDEHTATLSKGGTVFTFGSGSYGQLGHNSIRDELRPRLVAELHGSTVCQVCCGRHHTLVLVEPSRTIYSFGRGEHGQHGNGQKNNHSVPVPVHLPSEVNTDCTVQITAGGNHSLVLCSSQESEAHLEDYQPKGIVMLTDDMINRWLSEDETKMEEIKAEVRRVISSPSCLNCSFIERSKDKHYKTSRGHSGLNLLLARRAFERLSKRTDLLSEVEKVVEEELLCSLGSAAPGVEALRIYLILPELFWVLRQPQRAMKITNDLASAILNLDDKSFDVLMSLWKRLPKSFYKTLVKIFHSDCEHYISLMTTSRRSYGSELTPLLKVLQKLYILNGQRTKEQLTDHHFHIKKLTEFFTMESSSQKGSLLCDLSFLEKNIICYSFILEPECKEMLLKFLQIYYRPVKNQLYVNRLTALTDTIKHLKVNAKRQNGFTRLLQVEFFLEDGFDDGGVSTEFFTVIGQQIKSSNMFRVFEDSQLFWFSDAGSTKDLYFIGIICAMALYNNRFMNIGFPLALFKKLLNHSPDLSDLEELSPVEAWSLKQLLTDEDDVEHDMDFTVRGKELIPNGENVRVTKGNRQKYVDMYVDFVFNKAIEASFGEFARGFYYACPFNFWKMYKPEELMTFLYGTATYEWKELEKGALYENCEPSDELIRNFWTVFYNLDEELKKKFLKLIFATDRLPVGGLAKRQLTVMKFCPDDADDMFPEVHTCTGLLCLPDYSNGEILCTKLTHVINHCKDFGKR